MVRNLKKISTGHELNQVLKCGSSLLEGKEKNTTIVKMMMITCGNK